MKQYILNLLPRLQEFSKSLDKIENFVDKAWVLVDDHGNSLTYVFQRNNSLIMSVNGKAQIGRWDYIHAAKRLLLDSGGEKILLNHAFVEKGVMILKLDGSRDAPWVFANENEIPDLDVNRYLKELLISKLNLVSFEQNGKTYYFSNPGENGFTKNTRFYDENLQKTSDSFSFGIEEKMFDVQNGVIRRRYYARVLQTDKGTITLQCTYDYLSEGDLVFFKVFHVPDGVYKILKNDFYKSLAVKDGKIVSLKSKSNYTSLLTIGITLLFLGGVMVAILAQKGCL